MINVSHHRDDRRPGCAIASRLVLDFVDDGNELFFFEANIQDFKLEIVRNLLAGLDVDSLVDRNHDPERHELALDQRGLDTRLLGEFGDSDFACNAHDSSQIPSRSRADGER